MIREMDTRRVVVHEVEPSRLLVSTTRAPESRFWLERIQSAEAGAVRAGCHADASGIWERADRDAPPTLVEVRSLRVCLEGTPEEIRAAFSTWFEAQGFDPNEIANGPRRARGE